MFVSLLKQQETSENAPLLKDNVRLFIVISKYKLNFNLSSSIIAPKNKDNEVTLLCSVNSVDVPSDVPHSAKLKVVKNLSCPRSFFPAFSKIGLSSH